jgi:SHS2 domain-containing protein
MNGSSGYIEIEHTADCELHIWAPDMQGLLIQAARGMYEITGTRLAGNDLFTHDFEILNQDRESLLVDFLSELLFLAEDQHLGFDNYQILVNQSTWRFVVEGGKIFEQSKVIKAVTYHGIKIQETDEGLEVNIVFDI